MNLFDFDETTDRVARLVRLPSILLMLLLVASVSFAANWMPDAVNGPDIIRGLLSPAGILLSMYVVGFAREHNIDWATDKIAEIFNIKLDTEAT